jgi:hypothetical protein
MDRQMLVFPQQSRLGRREAEKTAWRSADIGGIHKDNFPPPFQKAYDAKPRRPAVHCLHITRQRLPGQLLHNAHPYTIIAPQGVAQANDER